MVEFNLPDDGFECYKADTLEVVDNGTLIK